MDATGPSPEPRRRRRCRTGWPVRGEYRGPCCARGCSPLARTATRGGTRGGPLPSSRCTWPAVPRRALRTAGGRPRTHSSALCKHVLLVARRHWVAKIVLEAPPNCVDSLLGSVAILAERISLGGATMLSETCSWDDTFLSPQVIVLGATLLESSPYWVNHFLVSVAVVSYPCAVPGHRAARKWHGRRLGMR